MPSKSVAKLAVMVILAAACSQPAPPVTARPDGIEPQAGLWKTWVLRAPDQFRAPLPPDQAATETEIRTLATLAGQRDAAALDLINFWDVGGPAFRWNEFVTDQITRNKMTTPASARARALVNIAVYDAMVATWDSKYAYKRPRPSDVRATLSTALPNPRSPSYPAEHAAAAGAASSVLAYLFPNEARAFAERSDEAGRSRLVAGVNYPSDITAGAELGRAVGAAVIERAKADGSDAAFTSTIPTGPGKWKGTSPQEPTGGQWKTLVLRSASQVDPGPPPAFGTPEFASALRDVKEFPRTADSDQAAFYWNSKGGQFWHDLTNKKIFEYHLDANPPRAARVYALVNVAAYDGTIAAWNIKYTYWYIRPVQADPEIKTILPTPSHPSYPSTNATSWGATAAILGYVFPADAELFTKQADEGAFFPFWAGIHFKKDCEAGLSVGRAVARLVIERARADGAK